MRRLFLAEITNVPTKSRWSPNKTKKKVFAEIRRLFLAEIANFNVFSAPKHQLLPPKKTPWGARKKSGGQKQKSRGHCPLCPPAGDVHGCSCNLKYKYVFKNAKYCILSLYLNAFIFMYFVFVFKCFLPEVFVFCILNAFVPCNGYVNNAEQRKFPTFKVKLKTTLS